MKHLFLVISIVLAVTPAFSQTTYTDDPITGGPADPAGFVLASSPLIPIFGLATTGYFMPQTTSFTQQIMNLETGVAEASSKYLHQGSNTLIPLHVNQRYARFAIGGPPGTPCKLQVLDQGLGLGARYLKELYAGTYRFGPRNEAEIYNEDTLFLEKLWVAKDAILTITGTAPVVITKEVHNYGTIIAENDNLVMQYDKENNKRSLFENKGTFVGRLEYEFRTMSLPQLVENNYLLNYFTDIPPSLEDSLDIFYNNANAFDQAILNSYYDSGQYDSAYYYLDEWYNSVEDIPLAFSHFHLDPQPLKGIRYSPAAGDIRRKYAQNHRGANTQLKSFYHAGDIEDLLEPLGSFEDIFDSDLSIAVDFSNVPVDIPAGYEQIAYFDTSVYVGNEALQLVYAWATNGVDSILIQDTVGYITPSIISNIQIFLPLENYNPEYSGLAYYYSNVADSADYQWYNLQNIPGSPYQFDPESPDFNPYVFVGGPVNTNAYPNSFSTVRTWFDPRIHNANKSLLHEDPNHLFIRDTTASNAMYQSLFSQLDNFQPETVTPYPAWTEGSEQYQQMGELYNWPPNFPALDLTEFGTSQFGSNYVDIIEAGGTFTDIDATTPLAVPNLVWRAYAGFQGLDINIAPEVTSHVGYPWMNSLEAYEHPYMIYHPQVPYQNDLIPNDPPNGSPNPHELQYPIPGTNSFQYVYAPNGNLFEAGTWAYCIDTVVNVGTSEQEAILLCQDNLYSFNPANSWDLNDNLSVFATNQLSDEFVDSLLADGTIEAIVDDLAKWNAGPFSNPTLGYLDLNQVAAEYLASAPELSSLEFKFWGNQFTNEGYNSNIGINNPFINEFAFSRVSQRKYYRYLGGVIADEFDFWLNLLLLQYQETGGAGFSDNAIAAAEAWIDGVIGPDDGAIYNYLLSADINPNIYQKISRYLPPGATLWATNNQNGEMTLKVNSDMAVYDFDLPAIDSNLVFLGDYGPWSLLTFTGSGTGRAAGRTSTTEDFSWSETLDNYSVITAWAYKDEESVWPYTLMTHSYNEDFNNGTQFNEDPRVNNTYTPFIFSDSASFSPSRYVHELQPHNQDPLHIYCPRPNIGGAWEFETIAQQSQGTSLFTNNTDPSIVRWAIQPYDTSGTTGPIEYLGPGDTYLVADTSYTNWPQEFYLYNTSLYGDVNGDGIVTAADFITILTAFGSCEDQWPNGFPTNEYDPNGDGCVTVLDLLTVIQNQGYGIGIEDGQFIHNYQIIDVPGMETAYEQAPSTRGIFTYNATTNTLNAQGEFIQVYSPDLKIVAEGYNGVSLAGIQPNTTYLAISDRSVGHFTQASLTNTTPAFTPQPVFAPIFATHETGSQIVHTVNIFTSNGNLTSDWIQFYTDYDNTIWGGSIENNVSPYIAQIYQGHNSNLTTGNLHSPVNAKITGLIDMFGNGTAANGVFDFTQENSEFASASHRYLNYSDFPPQAIFENKQIPLAMIAGKSAVNRYDRQTGVTNTLNIQSKYPGGLVSTFDQYAELASDFDATVTVWGQDFKDHYDYELHQGTLAMVDMMTLREYFKFKLQGVSPKFGIQETAVTTPRTTFADSFGPEINYEAAYGNQPQQQPAAAWAPAKCTNYQAWTDNIVAPFITAHLGQATTILSDPTPSTQNGLQVNSDNPLHYKWFTGSNLHILYNSYGPLVYDFNLNGTWDTQDLEIWEGITTVWSGLGDDGQTGEFAPASYYRPATDVLNVVVNALAEVDAKANRYDIGQRFNQYFDKDTYPFVDPDIINWHECLDGYEYVPGNLNQGAAVSDGSFAGSIDLPFVTGTTLDAGAIGSSAPRNTVGAVEVTDYGTIPTGYLVHPSPSFFPISNVRN